MKNILFIVISFLFLPFASYSQTALSYFEENIKDSSLTVFIKSSNTEHNRDTIYSKEIPKKLIFIFEDIDSTNRRSYAVVTLARGKRVINSTRANTNKIDYPTQYTIWETDVFVIEAKDNRKDSTEIFLQTIQILPIPIVEGIQKEKQKIIQDSLNRIAAIEYHKNRFEKLKEPQKNLTEKDKKRIANIYSKIKLTDGDKAKIGNHKLIDKGEIANIHWLEYLHFLLDDSLQTQYLANLPDSMIWNKLYNSYELDYHYLRNPAYRYYPVVGITYEQAQQYCIWRGNVVNEIVNEKYKNSDYEIIVYYRLPTKEEWEYAATKDDLNKQFGGYSTKRRYTEKEKRKTYNSAKEFSDSTYSIERVKLDMKNYFESDTSYRQMFNYRVDYQKPYFTQNTPYFYDGILTNWIFLFKPTNHFGLYNMFGNVAEMTSEKGIAKGGSFYHTLEECTADKVQVYDSPQAWLGFRCVVEVVVRKKDGK